MGKNEKIISRILEKIMFQQDCTFATNYETKDIRSILGTYFY